MEHTGNICKSFSRYFNTLEHLGHYDTRETRNLLLYLFIVSEIFDGRLSKHLDEEGLAAFNKVLQCVYKGCLVDSVRDNIRIKEPDPYRYNAKLRHSEVYVPRISSDEVPRDTEPLT